ncbi:MAG TPA: hypothetical protein VE173_11695, partial [Longimicrobiales bacterium]|nr:hypothetical protein [Longimicrobiales bacterium]
DEDFGSVAEDMRAAAVAGDVLGVRAAARELSERGGVEGISPEARPLLVELRRTARAIEGETDPVEAFRMTAALARRCGACHGEVGADALSLHSRGERSDVPASHEARLTWAVSRLWDGLAGPSDAAWRAGASAVADSAAFGSAFRRRLGDPGGADVALERLERLSRAAKEASAGSEERTRVLGEVVATCAGCHAAEVGVRRWMR